MNKLFQIFLIALLVSTATSETSFGQGNKEIGDRIKSKRIAYFTDKLQLTPEEAQKFWPVFNEYDQKRSSITAEKRKLTESFQNNSSKMNEAEVDKTISTFIKLSQQETQLIEDYNKKFRAILPAQKVMKLYLAETEFKVVLLRELKTNSKSRLAD